MNRKVEYALMALKVMAAKRPGELTSAKEVAQLTGAPFDATARVMQQMASREILRAEHGAHGGYLVIRDLSRVSVYELLEMILGPMALARCLQGSEPCDLHTTCNIVSPVTVLNRKMMDFYQGVTVGELLRLKRIEAVP